MQQQIIAVFVWVGILICLILFSTLFVLITLVLTPYLYWFNEDYKRTLSEDEELLSLMEQHLLPKDVDSFSTFKSRRFPGLEIRYFVSQGEPHEHVVLCIHGAASSSIAFSSMSTVLSKNYTMYSIDLPGFGRSSLPQGCVVPSTLEMCTYIHEFITEVISFSSSVHLVGHSFGAYLIAEHARIFPHHTKSATLLAPIGLFPSIGTWGAYWAVFFKLGLQNLPRHLGKTGFFLAKCFSFDTRNWLLLSLPRAIGHEILAKNIYLSWTHAYWKTPTITWLAQSETPTLIIFGKKDNIISFSQEEIINKKQMCDTLVFDNCDHSLHKHRETHDTLVDKIKNMTPSKQVSCPRIDPEMFASSFFPRHSNYIIEDMNKHIEEHTRPIEGI